MKTIIAGSRGCHDFSEVCKAIELSGFGDEISEIVSGGALGVDQLGEKFARKFQVPLKVFLADWKGFGKSAGMVRNRQMADYADALIAIRLNNSAGTTNMIQEAKKRKLKVFVHDIEFKEPKEKKAKKEDERVISGFCDACGQFSANLVVLESANIAGLCSCKECLS